MTTQNDGSLTPQTIVKAKDQAQVIAVGHISNVKHLHVGNRYQNRCQLTPPVVAHINPIPDNRDLKSWTDRAQAQAQAELLRRTENAHTLLIELVADGGFGKSSMAVWLSEQVESETRQVIWVELAAASTFSAFARWVLYELCVPTEDTMSEEFLTQQLVRCLRKTDCLLVLDQLEFIAQTQQRPFFDNFLTQWQHKQRGSTVLVTTRQRFLPQAELCLQLPGFTPDEGAAFLQKKAVSTALTDGLPRLSEICNGHPLLLNLSAAWLEKTTENTLDEDGLNFFSKLFENDLDKPEAQVEEVFEQLLDELSETLQLVLLETSVYRIPISLEMAQAMQPGVTAAELDSLEAQGFLLGQDSQWRLHPLVGELVSDRRVDELEAEAHGKAIECFQRQLQQETPSIQDYLECFHHYYECQDYEAAYDVIDRCYSWLDLNGNYRILVTVYEQLVTAWRAVLAINRSSQEKHGEALNRLGWAYFSQGDYNKTIDFYQQSLEIQRQIGDRYGIANSLIGLGLAYYSQGNYTKAIDFCQQALEIKQEIGDRKGIANSLIGLGNAYHSQGDYDKAIDIQQQSLEIRREIGDRKGIASSLFNLGYAYAKIDEHWKARDSYQQAKSVFTEIKLAHMVEKCDQAIQGRNRIISPTPKKAPSLPTKNTEPDWLAKSMPSAPNRSTARSQSSKRLFPKWLPYLALA
ncbi:MAG: tetratricopeptide repeat protein, partial [Phormidesmis sp.]